MVTILFSDLSDSTGIAAGLEPEQFADLLEQIRKVAHRVIPAHGGEIVRLDGDGMLCLFGFPTPFEDAGRRATEAALDMHAAMTALDLAFATPEQHLHLHSGVHAGLVLLRAGDIVRGKYEILGDATNIAARLCDAAAPGEILVSVETLGRAHLFFHTDAERPVLLRGRGTPLHAWPIKSRTEAGSEFEKSGRAGLTPFQGREHEKRTFAAWLNTTPDAAPLLLIHGPAGIGKSRFLDHVSKAALDQGWQVAAGYCESYLSARPLQPFHQIEEALAKEAGGSHVTLATTASSQTKLLLIIDDWQWADDASRDFLMQLLEGPAQSQTKIVLASREKGGGTWPASLCTDLPLPPLDRDATLGTIEMLMRAADPFAVDRIEQASGGSPLLIEELCHAFTLRQQTPTQDPRGAWFDQAVQSRFDRLGDQDKGLLKLSAVIGHMVPIWLIETLLGQQMETAVLDRLQAADFLFRSESANSYRFKHGLTRDALYAAVGQSERKALHAEVLAALEDASAERGAEKLLSSIAYHAIACGNAEKGVPYAIAAGDAALAEGALDRAQGHYQAGIKHITALKEIKAQQKAAWALLNKFGLACIVDPAPDQLLTLEQIDALLKTHGSPRHAMRSAYWLGVISDGVGFGKRSVQHLKTAVDLAQSGKWASDTLLVKTKLAHAFFSSGNTAEAVKQFDALLFGALGIATRHERDIKAYALAGNAFINAERGDFARAAALFDEADQVLGDANSAVNASIMLYRSAALVSQGAWEAAVTEAHRVLAVSQRSRTRMQSRTCRAQAAYARWQLTRAPEAAETLEQIALEFIVPGHSLQHVSMVFGWVVDVMVDCGDITKARRFMGHVLRRVREGGDRIGEAMGWRAMAKAAQDIGDDTRADRYLGFAQRSATIRLSRRESAHNLVCEATLLHARESNAAASALLNTAAQEFEVMAMPWFRDHALVLASGPKAVTSH